MEELENGVENRQLKRFLLEIPVQVDFSDTSDTPVNAYLLSRDLSGTGAYVFTRNPLPLNVNVKLGMILDIRPMFESDHKQYSVIEVSGTVLRSDSEGMAIRFGHEFKISPIERVLFGQEVQPVKNEKHFMRQK